MQSIRSRLMVFQVVQAIRIQSTITFDFVTLLSIARFVYASFDGFVQLCVPSLWSVLASLGLFENSSVILVASMLISPLMVSGDSQREKECAKALCSLPGPYSGDRLRALYSWSIVVESRSSSGISRPVRLRLVRYVQRRADAIARYLFSGFIIGLVTSIWETKWGSSTSFPTPEMKAR